MAQKNTNLHAAKNAKNDEFYTQYSDIAEEIKHYKSHFQDKVVYCNCDDPESSNFWKYFHNNFKSLGLKKLISTHYAPGYEVSYAKIYEGGDDFNMNAGIVVDIFGNDDYAPGDFRSDDSIRLLEEADIVVTNPPFSLFRNYVTQLMEYEKKFIIWGNNNAITYKEFFPLIKNNKVWLGYLANKTCYFQLSDNYEKWDEKYTKQKADGHKYGKVPAISTFTNLDIEKRHDGLWHLNGKFDDTKAHYHYKGFEERYPKYDNYDAINVDKVKDIPIDYFPCWYDCDKANTCEYAIKNQNVGATSVSEIMNNTDAEINRTTEQQNNRTTEQQNNRTTEQQNNRTTEQQNNRTTEQQNNRTTEQQNNRTTEQQNNRTTEQQSASSSVTELWESQLPTLINTVHLNLKSSEQQKVREKASQMDCGMPTIESHNQLLMENADINDCLCVEYCNGIMGVPITFLDKYNPDEFEICGMNCRNYSPEYRIKTYNSDEYKNANDLNGTSCIIKNNMVQRTYARIFIRSKQVYKSNNF